MIDPDDYWVNNPLITPVNKALLYDNAIDEAKVEERERIIALLESLKGPEKACCEDCQPHADKSRHYLTNVIAHIKRENE